MIFGHDDKVKLFKKLCESGSLRHAYLFFGEPQVGKFTFAKHLAYFLEVGKFEIGDRVLADAVFVSSDDGTIGIDEVRSLKTFIYQKPFNASRKLVIVDNAEKLTPQAQSSMLKFVEETPEFTTFIFIARDPQVLLPPLTSRLMYIYFSKMAQDEIIKLLIEEYERDKEEAVKAAKQSFGRLGRALDFFQDRKEDEEPDLEDYISNKIVQLFLEGRKTNVETLSWLLNRESMVNRFNTNKKLQKKAVEYRVKN